MPFRDGTGPEGRGPRTGRGLGGCRPRRILASVARKRIYRPRKIRRRL